MAAAQGTLQDCVSDTWSSTEFLACAAKSAGGLLCFRPPASQQVGHSLPKALRQLPMSQPFGLISLPQLWRAFFFLFVSRIAQHTWKRGAPALLHTGTVAEGGGVSVAKGRLAGTPGTFCHHEKHTKHTVVCSKQAFHSTVRAVQVARAGKRWGTTTSGFRPQPICEFSNRVHWVYRGLLGGGQCRDSSALALATACPNFWGSCCKNRIYDLG